MRYLRRIERECGGSVQVGIRAKGRVGVHSAHSTGFLWLTTIAVILTVPIDVLAQPTDLFACVGQGYLPYCRESSIGGITDLGCGQSFELYEGRLSFFPLRCAGPITIEVNARQLFSTAFPLYVEIVPGDKVPCRDPGYVVMIAWGGFDCGYWESLPHPIDITKFVPLGSTYALQVVFYQSKDFRTPGLDCIRITSHPVTPSALVPITWGRVKALYK